jgi:putative hemolysin
MRLWTGLIVVGCLMAACGGNDQDDPGLANPASVYCEEQGGVVDIRTADDGGQVGICVFADGAECEEWAFYRGECAPGRDA